MSTSPVPTAPADGPAARERPPSQPAAPRADRDGERSAPAPQRREPAPSDRTVDADLLIDIPQLSVEELSLEIDASLLLDRVKLDAKGLEAGLYFKADFDSLSALTQQGPRNPLGGAPAGSGAARARTERRELPAGSEDDPAPEPHDDDEREGEHRHDGSHPVRDRARHVLTHSAKAAGLTAAGAAGGALLEARGKASRRLPIPRRATGLRAIRDTIARRLP